MFLLLLIPALLLLAAAYAYRIAFYSPKKNRDRIPSTEGALYDPYRPQMRQMYRELADRPCEFVTIRSHDGLTLSGRCYDVVPGAPVDICFHGYRSHPLTDLCGGSRLCFSMGHNVILADQRAHGKSQGRSIAFGIRERKDVLGWIEFARKRFGDDVNITLYGVSMGAATVLMASGLDLPSNVKSIVADCPYANAEEIILEVGRHLHYPPALIRPFLHLGAFIYGGFRLGETDAVEAVKKTQVPILIIHGEADTFVPPHMSLKIAQANPEMVRRITFPGAEHGISYLVDTPRYEQAVRDFVLEHLP